MADSHMVQTRHSIASSTRLAVQIDRRVPRAVASAPRSWRPTAPPFAKLERPIVDVASRRPRKIGAMERSRSKGARCIQYWLAPKRAIQKINGDGAFFRDGQHRFTNRVATEVLSYPHGTSFVRRRGDHTARHQPSRAIADCQQLPVSVKRLACTEPIHPARRGRLSGAPRGSPSSVQKQ